MDANEHGADKVACPLVTDRTRYCCCCGAPRGVAQRRDSISLCEIVRVGEHRQLQRPPGFYYEQSPQLVAFVNVYRKGGASENQYICDDCLRLSLQRTRAMLDRILGPKPEHDDAES